jgi:ribosome-associated translation inhibitor RaiA
LIYKKYIKNEVDRFWLSAYLEKKLGFEFPISRSADAYLDNLNDSDRKLLLSQINQAWRVRKFRQKNKSVTVSLELEAFRVLEGSAKNMGISIPELIGKLIEKELRRVKSRNKNEQSNILRALSDRGTNWGTIFKHIQKSPDKSGL